MLNKICKEYNLNPGKLKHFIAWVSEIPKNDGVYKVKVEFYTINVLIKNDRIESIQCNHGQDEAYAKMAFILAFNNKVVWEELKKEIQTKETVKTAKKEKQYIRIINNNKDFWYNGEKGKKFEVINKNNLFVIVKTINGKKGVLTSDYTYL